jgi:hypothetical protein
MMILSKEITRAVLSQGRFFYALKVGERTWPKANINTG